MAWLDCKGSRHVKEYTLVTTTDDGSSEEEILKQPNNLALNPINTKTKLNGRRAESKSPKHKARKFKPKLEKTCQSFSIICLAVAICLLVFVIATLIRTIVSEVPVSDQTTRPVMEQSWEETENRITTPKILNPLKQTENWEVRLSQEFTESNVRLVDVDGDGLLDIIVTTSSQVLLKATAKIKGKQVTKEDFENICHNAGKAYPCIGILMAYRGYDGKQLWVTYCKSDMFVINCDLLDINKDGKKDCIAAGRQATLTAFDPYKAINQSQCSSDPFGKYCTSPPRSKPYTCSVIWEGEDGKFLRTDWNTYQPQALPDWDGDGVPEILVVNGGAPIIPRYVHNRTAGRLIVFSGATGRQLGQRYLEVPQSKESYMSPVIYKSTTGSSYILFGSGGETVPGDLLGISVPDFCKYIMGSQASVCPPPEAEVIWNAKVRDTYGIFILFSDSRKGVMVPPVIVDVNRDGVDDIVVNSYGGFVTVLDGVNLRPIWITEFYGMESYSTPAPGYFDDDDYIDFMVHHNFGAWPDYSFSYTTVLSGRDGSKLWSLRSNMLESTSDFTLRTKQDNRDLFLFRIKGRESSFMYNTNGTIVRVEDISQNIETRKRRHTDDEKEQVATLQPGVLRKEKIKVFKSEHDKSFMSCEMDLKGNTAEVFLIDRSTLHFGIRIKEDMFEKVRYDTTDGEEHCMVLSPYEFSTGAIADVDGDGTLDYLSIVPLLGVKVNSDYSKISKEYVTKIGKVNIFPYVTIMDRIHLNAATPIQKNSEDRDIEEVGVLPPVQQQWTQYLGNNSDSHYYSG